MKINSTNFFKYPNFTANVMPKNCAEYINSKLKNAKTVDIFCHKSSDEDTFNSAKAMYSYLKSNGISPRIIASNAIKNFEYDTKNYNIIQDYEINKNTKKSDIALCVDFSSPNRLPENVLNYIKKYDKNIVGFDHHNDNVVVTSDYNKITQSYAKTQAMPAIDAKNYYIDSSAKSNCAIISRFFDAIGHKISSLEAKFLLAGMIDDTAKNGTTKIDKSGNITVNDKINDNGNTKEVMENVLSNINQADKTSVIKHLTNKVKLSDKEFQFLNNLENKVQYSSNGKYAYVEISKDDKEWLDLGKDTLPALIALKQFRENTLNKNQNICAVAVFYPTNEKNNFKMSILTKEDYAKQIIDNIKATTYPELIAGGHENRSGGYIVTTDDNVYHDWINLFKNSAEKVLTV